MEYEISGEVRLHVTGSLSAPTSAKAKAMAEQMLLEFVPKVGFHSYPGCELRADKQPNNLEAKCGT